jgi:hypothetical protein
MKSLACSTMRGLDAVDVANDAVAVPGAEVAAEALASIAADEELPSATDVESATMAEPANVPESDFGDIESPEEFDGTVDRIVDELKSGNRAGAMSIFSGLSATDIERVTAEITGAGFNNQTRADMLADLDNRLKFKNQSAREVFYTLDKDRAALRAKRTPKPISPDGDVATPSTETPALPLAETAQEPAIAPAAESAATPEKPLQPVANKSAVWIDDESKRADAIMERYGPQIDEVDADQLDAFAEKFGVKRRGKSDSALREEIKGQHPDDILAAFTGNPTQQEPTTETGRQVKEAFAGMASAATEGARRRVAELIDKGPYILENKAAGDAALANPDYRAERLPDGRVQITDVVNPDTGEWHKGDVQADNGIAAKVPKGTTVYATNKTKEGIEASIRKFYGGEKKNLVPIGGGEFAVESESGKRLGSKVIHTEKGFHFVDGQAQSNAATQPASARDATKPEQMSPEVERLKYLKSREVNAAGGTSLSDAEDEELAELTGQFPPTYRDPSKPEQMLPREVEKAAVEKKLSEGVGARLKGANKKSYVLGVEAGARREHRSAIADAFDDNKPVSTEAVDTYGITIPAGYEKQGELYVFAGNKSESNPAESNEKPSQVTETAPGTVPVTLNSPAGKAESNLTAEEIQDEIRENKFLETALKSLIDCLKSK